MKEVSFRGASEVMQFTLEAGAPFSVEEAKREDAEAGLVTTKRRNRRNRIESVSGIYCFLSVFALQITKLEQVMLKSDSRTSPGKPKSVIYKLHISLALRKA